MDKQTTWIPTHEALRLLSLKSRTTLYKYAAIYNLRCSKLGGESKAGKMYYDKDCILNLLDSRSIN